uniref:Borealin N-terminal domain-containing protein n=1 Tax=Dicentrarchus labrax TaxID=13489 RepID=A0A8C4I2F7_DICLA
MPLRRTRNAQVKEQLGREMRQSRLALFIQQFEKEAQERMNELEAKMENMLATVDKVFKVELMKMPPSLQNTFIGDLISGEYNRLILQNESLEMHQPLRRAPSKRGEHSLKPCSKCHCLTLYYFKTAIFCAFIFKGKSTDSTPGQSTPAQRTSSKTSKVSNVCTHF